MTFQEQNRYPFPADIVVQVFADKDYFLAKYQRAGATNIELLEESIDGDRSRITISRQVDIDVDVPAFAHRFVPDTITTIQTDSWDRASKRGHLDIRFKGMPAEVKCDMTLTDQGDEAVLDLHFSVRINVPLIGDKLAKVLAQDLQKKFHSDSAEARRLMAEFASRYS